MNYVLYIVIGFIILLIFLLLKNLSSNIFVILVCSLLIVTIVGAPKLCMQAALGGAKLFSYSVFPSVFPFLVLCNLLVYYDGIEIYGKLFGKILCKPMRLPIECSLSLIISFLCGYPLGAKYACDLYEQGKINFATCERLINIASNGSPLFIIGVVGTAMLKNPWCGYILCLSNYCSCFCMSFILPPVTQNMEHVKMIPNSVCKDMGKKNIGTGLKNSIENSIATTLSIGGFIIIFSVIIEIIKNSIALKIIFKLQAFLPFNIPEGALNGVILGILEMTNGCHLLSISSLDLFYKMIIISFLLGFSGFCIIAQAYSFAAKYKFSFKKYISRKFFQGVICSSITIVLYNLEIPRLFTPVFLKEANTNIISYFMLSLFLLTLPLILYKVKYLFHAS